MWPTPPSFRSNPHRRRMLHARPRHTPMLRAPPTLRARPRLRPPSRRSIPTTGRRPAASAWWRGGTTPSNPAATSACRHGVLISRSRGSSRWRQAPRHRRDAIHAGLRPVWGHVVSPRGRPLPDLSAARQVHAAHLHINEPPAAPTTHASDITIDSLSLNFCTLQSSTHIEFLYTEGDSGDGFVLVVSRKQKTYTTANVSRSYAARSRASDSTS